MFLNNKTKLKIYLGISRWFQYWIDLFSSIVGILTLGLYRPMWDFKFITWRSKLIINYRIKNKV